MSESKCLLQGGFYAGDSTDCNGDVDQDNVPDACDFCPGDDRADLSGNRKINLEDFALLEADFGCTSGCTADINGDGKTDLLDAELIFEAWLCGTVP